MKLADFLQWEEPQQVWGSGGVSGQPRIWIKRNLDKKRMGGYSLMINQAFLRDHLPLELKGLNDKSRKSNGIGVAVNVDRQKKLLHIVFNPPKNVPQYLGKMYTKGSGTVNVTNKMLGDDIWTLFDMPDKVTKQFFEFEMHKEVEGRKVFRLSYNPKSEANAQALIYNSIKPTKK